jgi:ABC-type lipoprotein release transport system permease subunit
VFGAILGYIIANSIYNLLIGICSQFNFNAQEICIKKMLFFNLNIFLDIIFMLVFAILLALIAYCFSS